MSKREIVSIGGWSEGIEYNPFSKDSLKEEHECISLAKTGCQKSKKRLLEAEVKFILSFARNYTDFYGSLSEAFSIAYIGFEKAIQKFDLSTKNRLHTMAGGWIKSELNREPRKYKPAHEELDHLYDIQGEIFDLEPYNLCKQEKEIIGLHINDKMRVIDIARHYGVSQKEVKKTLASIASKIKGIGICYSGEAKKNKTEPEDELKQLSMF